MSLASGVPISSGWSIWAPRSKPTCGGGVAGAGEPELPGLSRTYRLARSEGADADEPPRLSSSSARSRFDRGGGEYGDRDFAPYRRCAGDGDCCDALVLGDGGMGGMYDSKSRLSAQDVVSEPRSSRLLAV